jgi:hypothetical protein
MDALPGRVRARIRARRPAAILRAPWVWPLAAGLALAVIAPLVLREGRSRDQPQERAAATTAVPQAGMSATPAGPPSQPAPEPARAATRDLEADREARSERVERPRASRQDAGRRLAPPPPRAEDAPSPPRLAESVVPAAPAAAPAPETAIRDDARANEAFAAAPPAEEEARAETPPPARGLAAGGAAAAMRKSEGKAAIAAGEEPAYGSAAALSLTTAVEARRAREAWRRFVAQYPGSVRADEARVRMVEASVAAFLAGGEAADRRAAERDGAAYLARTDAPQSERVQAALRRLDPPR